MNAPLFLDATELAQLTGIKVGRDGKTREERQIAELKRMGVAFRVNAAGRPVVTRAAIEGRQSEAPPAPGWIPRVVAG